MEDVNEALSVEDVSDPTPESPASDEACSMVTPSAVSHKKQVLTLSSSSSI